MTTFKFGRLLHAALAVSIAATPAFAAKSNEGMQVKLVSARKYLGKNAKYVKPAKVAKAVPKRPMVLTSTKVDAPTPKEMQNRTVVVSANQSQPIEKMKPITASHTPTVSKARAQQIAKSTTAKAQRPSVTRDTVSGTTRSAQPSVRTVVVNEDAPEKDLTETLDRLPIVETRAATPATSVTTRITTPAKTDEAPLFKPVLQMKNRLNTGRKYELEEIGGKNYSRKHELIAGLKHRSGFGAAITGSVSATSFADDAKNSQTTGDITTLLYHPGFYNANGWDIYGLGRVFFPTSDASKPTNTTRYYYYLGTNFDFGGRFHIENGLGSHYWTKSKWADDDVYFLLEEELYGYYKINDWLSIASGPYLQSASKEREAPATSVEIATFFAANIGDHVYFEPKLLLPVYVDGNIGNPRSAAMSEIGGEFYLKLFL